MLGVLRHSGLGRVVAVVTRYFGGIKLGAGGLVRAYGQAVKEGLTGLPVTEFVYREPLMVTLPYSLLDSFEHWLYTREAQVSDRAFGAEVRLVVEVPRHDADAHAAAILTFGEGRLTVDRAG